MRLREAVKGREEVGGRGKSERRESKITSKQLVRYLVLYLAVSMYFYPQSSLQTCRLALPPTTVCDEICTAKSQGRIVDSSFVFFIHERMNSNVFPMRKAKHPLCENIANSAISLRINVCLLYLAKLCCVKSYVHEMINLCRDPSSNAFLKSWRRSAGRSCSPTSCPISIFRSSSVIWKYSSSFLRISSCIRMASWSSLAQGDELA